MNKLFAKTMVLVLNITICLLVFPSSSMVEDMKYSSSSSSYDIACIYEAVKIPSGTKALDDYGNLKEVKAVYVPTKIDTGKYTVDITRIDSNFYQICGTELYIETRYCYEYATREEVVLNISSNYGYTRGEVIFF